MTSMKIHLPNRIKAVFGIGCILLLYWSFKFETPPDHLAAAKPLSVRNYQEELIGAIVSILKPNTKKTTVKCKDSPVVNLQFSPRFVKIKSEFDKHIIDNKLKVTEGYSGNVVAQYQLYYYLSQQPWVSTICEVGFNAGHSALQWLADSSPTTKLFSFDKCKYDYTRHMLKYVQETFPERFNITCGDSTKTLPDVKGLDKMCDIVSIDGGHFYHVASADLLNFKRLANPEHHVVIMDDTTFLPQVGRAWNDMLDKRLINHTATCNPGERGFSVGHYIIS